MYQSQFSNSKLTLQHEKNQMEINKKLALEQIQKSAALDKIYLQAFKKECEARRHTNVVMNFSGGFELMIYNPLVKLPTYSITNFKFISISELFSSCGKNGFFKVRLGLNGTIVDIFLNERKVGNANYLIRKFAEKGGQIFSDKKQEKANIASALWTLLRGQCTEQVMIPEHMGWMRITEMQYRFVEKEALLWESIEKLAK